jgi:hypothetical protein
MINCGGEGISPRPRRPRDAECSWFANIQELIETMGVGINEILTRRLTQDEPLCTWKPTASASKQATIYMVLPCLAHHDSLRRCSIDGIIELKSLT